MTKRLPSLVLPLLVSLSVAVTLPAARLGGEASAFLRANADSPVDWQPWGDAALARARDEKKPVYLVIGAFTNELSRAMRVQSFANADTAKLLNENFVCILVDREEHPELAALYQAYVTDVKQAAGWPLNLWLTPELLPYDGSAYLPPTEEWGKTSFVKIAQQAKTAWATDAAGCRSRAAAAVDQLAASQHPGAPAAHPEKSRTRLAGAADAWRAQYDAVHGGFSDAPKSPEPELLRFLLRQSPADREAALATLRVIAASALRDPLDGGFFRYASDAQWRVPYAQKTLADQARLAQAYLDAAQGDDAKAFAPVVRGALDFALNRLRSADGTFAAGDDATADEFAGYYAWTEAEIDAALGAAAAAFKSAHGVETAGNVAADDDLAGHFKGRNLLRAALNVEPGDAAAAARLLAVRAARPSPPRDERATAGAHGLLLAALARAGGQLGEARYTAAAAQLFAVVQKEFLLPAGDGLRRLRGSAGPATPADYAAVALGCREFGRVAGRKDADALATRLLAQAAGRFLDPAAGRYYVTPAARPAGIFVRPLAAGDPPTAESLALLAGIPPEQATVVVAALAAGVDEAGAPVPGDQLLALALAP